MIKQEVTWYSVKEDGNPKKFVNGGFVFIVKNRYSSLYQIKRGGYDGRRKVWFYNTSEFGSADVDTMAYEILYYTADLNYTNIHCFFSDKE